SIVGGKLQLTGTSLATPPIEPVSTVDGVPFLQGLTPGLKAIGALIRYGRFRADREAKARTPPEGDRADDVTRAERARALIRAAGRRALSEHEGKAILELYGISTTCE